METPDLSTTLAKNFAELSEWVKVAADNTGAFISREAPLFVQEYVRWVIVKGCLWLLIGVVFTVAVGLVIRWFLQQTRKPDAEDGWMVGFIFACILGGGGTLVLWSTPVIPAASDALKAYVAPRVLLVEKAAELSGIRK